MQRTITVLLVTGLILLTLACGAGPPQPGTPEFYWAAVKTAYATGDYLKANDGLAQLVKTDSELGVRSQPLAIIISTGIAQAYTELSDSFDKGSEANRDSFTALHRQTNVFRSHAGTATLECAEAVQKFLAGAKADSITVELPYPTGNVAEPAQLERISKGANLPAGELETLQRDMLRRGVVLSMLHFVGAGDDPAKGAEIFKSGEVKVPRAVFVEQMAKALLDRCDLFSGKKLDKPEQVNMFCDMADQGLKSIPATNDTKALSDRLAKIRKAVLKKT